MIRRTQGVFRLRGEFNVSVGRTNVMDGTYADVAVSKLPQRTTGARILDSLGLMFPATSDACKIISFTVGGRLLMGVSAVATSRTLSGRLGRIVAGLTTRDNQTGISASVPWALGPGQLPNDLTLVGNLWTPNLDSAPPTFVMGQAGGPDDIPGGYNPAGLQLRLAQTLPAPIPIPAGANALIGIWMEPSLVAADPALHPAASLWVMDATYSLVYDDGDAG